MQLFDRGVQAVGPVALLLLTPTATLAQREALDPDRGLPLKSARRARFTTNARGVFVSVLKYAGVFATGYAIASCRVPLPPDTRFQGRDRCTRNT